MSSTVLRRFGRSACPCGTKDFRERRSRKRVWRPPHGAPHHQHTRAVHPTLARKLQTPSRTRGPAANRPSRPRVLLL